MLIHHTPMQAAVSSIQATPSAAHHPVEARECSPKAVHSPSAGHRRDDQDLDFKDLISDSTHGQMENLLEGLLDEEFKPSPAEDDISHEADDSTLDFTDLIASSIHGQTENLFEGLIHSENNTSPTEDDPVSRPDENVSNASPRHLQDKQKDTVLKRGYDEFTELIMTSNETYNTREYALDSNIFREPTIPASHYRASSGDQISKRQAPQFSPLTNFASPASFASAYTPASYLSADTPASFLTAKSTVNSPMFPLLEHDSALIEQVQDDSLTRTAKRRQPNLSSIEYYNALLEKDLLLSEDKELNWSGKGQHVEYALNEKIPLVVLSHLGSSISATVDKVLCRRIALAKKTMRCTRMWNIKEALGEVEHLHRLRHAHIVQLVGSFLQGRNFSILLYPAADCHLGIFLEETADLGAAGAASDTLEVKDRRAFLPTTFSCLSSAIAYVHHRTTKHMDIKPANILVRRTSSSKPENTWRVYLADFGLSRSFTDQDHSQTDGPTARTPKYCAPEVYEYESRGRSADIFSLGCVFLEIYTVLCDCSVQGFADFRRDGSGEESFRANLDKVSEWVDMLATNGDYSKLAAFMLRMVSLEPSKRPDASELVTFFRQLDLRTIPQTCQHEGPEPYEVYEELWP